MNTQNNPETVQERFFGLFTTAQPTASQEINLPTGTVLEVTYGNDISREYFGLTQEQMSRVSSAEKTFFTPLDFACNVLGGIAHLKDLFSKNNAQ